MLPIAAIVLPSRVPPRKGLLSTSIGKRIITVTLRDGTRMRCRFGEFYSIVEVFGLKIYQSPEIDFEKLETIVDIGANIGAASLWFLRQAPDCRVFSIEPDALVSQILDTNCSMNDSKGRMKLVRAAIGGDSGVGRLIQGDSSTTNRIVLEFDTAGRNVEQQVPVYSLRDLFSYLNLESVDLIKLDCEGAEFATISRSSAADLQRVGVIIGEFHNSSGHPEDLETALTRVGFSFRIISAGEDAGMFVAARQSITSS